MQRLFIIIGLALLPTVTQAASAIGLSEFVHYYGSTVQALAGTVTADIGDVNGDGFDDVAIAAPDAGDLGEGAVYVLYGQASRLDDGTLEDLPTLTGQSSGDHLGEQLGGLGDINDDGYEDWAIVSNHHDSSDNNPGTVYIIYGQASTYSNQSVSGRPRFYGEDDDAGLGAAVRGIGDFTNDGIDDFAIGSSLVNNYDGGVYIVRGSTTNFSGTETLSDYTFLSGDEFDRAGTALASGDVTNDGISDLVVGANRHDDNGNDAGRVYVVAGQSATYTDQALDNFPNIAGTTARERVGVSVAVGEVTGDSYLDFLIGAPYNDDNGDNAGKVYVVPGQAVLPNTQSITTGTNYHTEQDGDLFGYSLAVLADVSGDGIDDWLVGAPSELDSKGGKAFLETADDDYPFTGEVVGDIAGTTVAAADLNGDGQDELVVGAPQHDTDSGAVYIGYWPVYTCENSVALGGILADYPVEDYKLRNYAENSHYKIAIERHGRQGFVLNCRTNEIEQTLTFNERVQRKIVARVFSARNDHFLVVVTRTPSKRRIKVFLYKQTADQLVETDYLRRKWRPRGLRVKLRRRNKIVIQGGAEFKHHVTYLIGTDLTLIQIYPEQ